MTSCSELVEGRREGWRREGGRGAAGCREDRAERRGVLRGPRVPHRNRGGAGSAGEREVR